MMMRNIAVVLALYGASAGCSIARESSPGPLQVPSPDWRDQVIYFVLTDRFADGDPSNNDQGAGEYNPAKSSHYSGGDLQGIQQKLDYIQGLGATAVWLTPPVAHQWWSEKAQYAGYHGYWATDFASIDAHYGTLADYQALSRDLHGRGMYLIQDIVVNHTGNFFGYDGPYDASDTAKNFVLYEGQSSRQRAPVQPPFDQINRLNPAHAKADIYHWTPPISDPSVPGQEFSYQLATLADLNTSNPRVRQALKHSYRYWLEQAGVDAYRIDTAKYVEHEFWQDFLHAPDGVLAKARELGKQHFLAFGEVFEASKPFSADGEAKLRRFLGSADKPELNSVIAFPLYFEINHVLAEGQPPAQLGYRLQQHVSQFPQPHVLPTFLNNHDTKRFLAAGSPAAFLQAYALLFTIPGIPVIYQGDEQLLPETRQAMFAGGWGAKTDAFRPQHPMYQHIRQLADLRKQHRLFSRGEFQLLQADAQGAGILAYQMRHAGQRAVVVMNTADSPRLLTALPLGAGKASVLWQSPGAWSGDLPLNAAGELTLELPGRAVLVLQPEAGPVSPLSATSSLQFSQLPDSHLQQDVWLQGKTDRPELPIWPVLNGQLHQLPAIRAAADGSFRFLLPVRNLGQQQQRLQLYQPDTGALSPVWQYQTQVTVAGWAATVADPVGDDRGADGSYLGPTQPHAQQQRDIRGLSARAGGDVLELELQMQQISQFWAPANGFDNVHLALFFHLPGAQQFPSADELPGLQRKMPHQLHWQLGHFLFGWGNSVFSAEGASRTATGKKLGAAPQLEVDAAKGLIRIRYDAAALGLPGWDGAKIYLSTWDKSGEGVLRSIELTPSPWNFTASSRDAAKVMDDVWLELKATNSSDQ
jgi:glycosidase